MIKKCKRIDEKLGITILLDSNILNDQIYHNLEKVIGDNDLDVMLIFFCEEPVLGLKFGLKISEILSIVNFMVQFSKRKVYCDIYSDLSFDKNKVILLNKLLSKIDRNKFNYCFTPTYIKGVAVSKFKENISILEGLGILGEVSCVICRDSYDEDMNFFISLKNSFSSVIANPNHGEEVWFYEKLGSRNIFYPTHEIEYEDDKKETMSIYDLRNISNFKGYTCNKKNHLTIQLSGPVYFCMTDFIDKTNAFDIYNDLPELNSICDKHTCQHEDNVSVCR